MEITINDASGLWKPRAPGNATGFDLRREMLARFSKAEGHINAADRYIWNRTDRGLWSAHQALARMAEAWLVLAGELTVLSGMDHYLPEPLLQERLAAFAAAEKPEPINTDWNEVQAAEAVIRTTPFPNVRAPLSPEDRKAMTAGLQRKHRYIDGLRTLLKSIETTFAERFVAVKPGDWLCRAGSPRVSHASEQEGAPESGLPYSHDVVGQILLMKGITLWVFSPPGANDSLPHALTGHSPHYAGFARCDPPVGGPIAEPGYHWLLCARDNLNHVRRDTGAARHFGDICRNLLCVMDAAAKAWWSSFAPEADSFSWQYIRREAINALVGEAPAPIATPLVEGLARLDTTASWQGTITQHPRDQERLSQLHAIADQAEAALAALEQEMAPRVDLSEGNWIRLADEQVARISKRDGLHIELNLGHGETREVGLFHELLDRCAPGDFPDAGPADMPKPLAYLLKDMLFEWSEAIEDIKFANSDSAPASEEAACQYYKNRAIPWREDLDRFIDLLGGEQALSADQRERLNRADEAFRQAAGKCWPELR